MPADIQVELIAGKIKSYAQEDKIAFDADMTAKSDAYAEAFEDRRIQHTGTMVALDANYTSFSSDSYDQDVTDLQAATANIINKLTNLVDSSNETVDSLNEANTFIAAHNEKYDTDLKAAISEADAEYDAYVAQVGEFVDFTAGFTGVA